MHHSALPEVGWLYHSHFLQYSRMIHKLPGRPGLLAGSAESQECSATISLLTSVCLADILSLHFCWFCFHQTQHVKSSVHFVSGAFVIVCYTVNVFELYNYLCLRTFSLVLPKSMNIFKSYTYNTRVHSFTLHNSNSSNDLFQ